jgi:hypothetical protein
MPCTPGKRGEQGQTATFPGKSSAAMHGGIHGALEDRWRVSEFAPLVVDPWIEEYHSLS